jgi:hypothetical protein
VNYDHKGENAIPVLYRNVTHNYIEIFGTGSEDSLLDENFTLLQEDKVKYGYISAMSRTGYNATPKQ